MYDFYIVDFLIPSRWLLIEVDGGYHSSRQEYDQRRERYLKRKGFQILRFSNEEILSGDPQEIIERIKAFPQLPPPLTTDCSTEQVCTDRPTLN